MNVFKFVGDLLLVV